MDALPALAHRLIAIVGPTGSGKSDLASRLAEVVPAEIVSCDSLQVYRGLDIGSAKPPLEARRRTPHHLIDVVDPDQAFSAAEYAVAARRAVAEVQGRDRLPIVVGGTGLYLRALLVGLFEGPSRDAGFRQRVEGIAARYGDARLHRVLRRVDPVAADRVHPRDRVRVVRALEVFRATGRPLSEHHGVPGSPWLAAACVLGLALDRDELRRRIQARTRSMLQGGLLEEVRGLLRRGYAPGLRPLQAIGYRQALTVLLGGMTVEDAERDIVTATMQYAKRQMTWFRNQTPRVRWHSSAEAALKDGLGWLASPGAR
jgi:tRNA dimethylallyltransferase